MSELRIDHTSEQTGPMNAALLDVLYRKAEEAFTAPEGGNSISLPDLPELAGLFQNVEITRDPVPVEDRTVCPSFSIAWDTPADGRVNHANLVLTDIGKFRDGKLSAWASSEESNGIFFTNAGRTHLHRVGNHSPAKLHRMSRLAYFLISTYREQGLI